MDTLFLIKPEPEKKLREAVKGFINNYDREYWKMLAQDGNYALMSALQPDKVSNEFRSDTQVEAFYFNNQAAILRFLDANKKAGPGRALSFPWIKETVAYVIQEVAKWITEEL